MPTLRHAHELLGYQAEARRWAGSISKGRVIGLITKPSIEIELDDGRRVVYALETLKSLEPRYEDRKVA